MPVTARLSKAFYDRFGEQVTNELVGWFNDVDATYRSDLKDFNELNFARFDAKVEQRFAFYDAKWETRLVEFESRVDQRFVALEAKVDQRFVALEAKVLTTMEQRFAEQTRWMFGTLFAAWVTLMIPIITLLVRR